MAITLIQSAKSQTNASSTTTTFGSATTPGNLLVAYAYTNGSTCTVTGFTLLVGQTYSGTSQRVVIYYKIADGTETTVVANGNTITRQHIVEFSGLANPAVTDGTNSNSVSTTTTISTNSITTTIADDLLVSVAGTGTGETGSRSWDSSFSTMLDDASSPRLLSGYRIVSATGTYSTTATIGTTATNLGACIGSFQTSVSVVTKSDFLNFM